MAEYGRRGLLLLVLCLVVGGGVRAEEPATEPVPAVAAPLAVSPEHAEEMAAGLELFRGGVSEILRKHCVDCHGGKKTEGDLDLATREGLLAGGLTGAGAVVGKPAESLIMKLIRHEEEPGMPFEADKLPDEAIALLEKWVSLGAPYDQPLVERAAAPKGRAEVTDADREFWSFQPIHDAVPPAVNNAAWCQNPLDQFVLSKLEAAGLTPNGMADRRVLIRRATFDLLGLPPTPEEIDAFVNDSAADAYSRLLDRLLASPHYGERWGRHWLDLARFAESHGYEQDYDRPHAYHYRDFVIKALNADMPYDQFVRWQIAGDELAPQDPLAMMATGYLGAGTHATQITANQAEKERYDELDDMGGTVGTSLLGLTIGCARCHDHKFDPIPQADYYRLISTFTTTVRSDMDIDLNPQVYEKAKAEYDAAHAPLATALAQFESEQLPARVDAWLATNPVITPPAWLIADATIQSSGGATFAQQADGSYLASGTKAEHDTYTVLIQSPLSGISGLRLEAMTDPSLAKGGPGRADNGNFALSDIRVTAAPLSPADGQSADAVPVKLVNPQATFEQASLPIAAALDEDPKSGWAVDPEFGKNHTAAFEFEAPVAHAGGVTLTITIKFETNTAHSIGRPRFSLTTAAAPLRLDDSDMRLNTLLAVQQALATPAADRNDEQRQAITAWYRATDADWTRLNDAVQTHARTMPTPVLTKVMVCSEGVPAIRLHTQGPDFYEQTFFLKRGDLAQKNGPATQGFLQAVMRNPEMEKRWIVTPPAGATKSYRRTSLANWLTDTEAGAGDLLARVIVNRLWQHHFHRGIVATASDFGAQGERPTHPELLDYLAAELQTSGWRLKSLHKQMMLTAAYQQTTDYDPAKAQVDPDNKLLWRRSIRRLEGEAIRDAMLATGALLDTTMFGPGSLDEAQRRRSIYFTIKRSQLIPLMMLFDGLDSLQSNGNRSSTTIAPQALALMNNPQVQASALGFATRLQPQADASLADAVKAGYVIAVGRPPLAEETSDAVAFIEQQTESYRVAGKPEPRHLALADFCQALYCLNEFVYVE